MRVFDQNSEWKVWCWPLWPAPSDQPVPIKTACYSSRGHHTNHTRITGTSQIFYLVIIFFYLYLSLCVCAFQVGITRTTRRSHFFEEKQVKCSIFSLARCIYFAFLGASVNIHQMPQRPLLSMFYFTRSCKKSISSGGFCSASVCHLLSVITNLLPTIFFPF